MAAAPVWGRELRCHQVPAIIKEHDFGRLHGKRALAGIHRPREHNWVS